MQTVLSARTKMQMQVHTLMFVSALSHEYRQPEPTHKKSEHQGRKADDRHKVRGSDGECAP